MKVAPGWKACLVCSKPTNNNAAVIVITNTCSISCQTQIGSQFSKEMLGRKVFLSVTLVLP